MSDFNQWRKGTVSFREIHSQIVWLTRRTNALLSNIGWCPLNFLISERTDPIYQSPFKGSREASLTARRQSLKVFEYGKTLPTSYYRSTSTNFWKYSYYTSSTSNCFSIGRYPAMNNYGLITVSRKKHGQSTHIGRHPISSHTYWICRRSR